METAIAAIISFFVTEMAGSGLAALGWVLAIGLSVFIFKLDSAYKAKLEAQLTASTTRYDNLVKEHKDSLDGLYDKVADLQDSRVNDANASKDEFVALTEKVLDALHDLGAKK